MHKIIYKVILLFILFSLQSCSVHCLFRPESKFEEILELLAEEEMHALTDGPADPAKKGG